MFEEEEPLSFEEKQNLFSKINKSFSLKKEEQKQKQIEEQAKVEESAQVKELKSDLIPFEPKTTWFQQRQRYYNSINKRRQDWAKIPHSSGVVVIAFPNGKFFISGSDNIDTYWYNLSKVLFPNFITKVLREKDNELPIKVKWAN